MKAFIVIGLIVSFLGHVGTCLVLFSQSTQDDLAGFRQQERNAILLIVGMLVGVAMGAVFISLVQAVSR